jgi:hypothetical protein
VHQGVCRFFSVAPLASNIRFLTTGLSRYHRWIPAFAGMTEAQCLTGKPLSDGYVITLLSFPRMKIHKLIG